MLTVLDHLPDGLLEREAADLHQALDGPTLLHLPGTRPEPLFVSVLLHGNEVTGWEAVRALLGEYGGRTLPRALSILVGNVAAARLGRRRLDGQPDYNRVWRGAGTPEHEMAAAVIDQMRVRGVFASIDVHNNSGENPHYACVNTLDPEALELAAMFGPRVVYFEDPDTVLALAFSTFCPAVGLECGKPGQTHGVEHARRYLETCLRLEEFPERRVPASEIELYRTAARLVVPPSVSFDFDGEAVDLRLDPSLDRFNFQVLEAGTEFGRVRDGAGGMLCAVDHGGKDRAAEFFEVRDGRLVSTRALMPAMLTLDARIVRQDCLGYLMERYRPEGTDGNPEQSGRPRSVSP